MTENTGGLISRVNEGFQLHEKLLGRQRKYLNKLLDDLKVEHDLILSTTKLGHYRS
jgi:hypothetical protein